MFHHRALGGLLLITAIGMVAATSASAAGTTSGGGTTTTNATHSTNATHMKKRMHMHKMGVHMDSALVAQATVKPDSAQAIALHKVPGGTVRSGEIERENGKLIYSYDIKVAGKSGVDEVNIDAMDGSVLSVKHESARMEKRESANPRQEEKHEGATSGH